ncbi:DUF2177 family protein [Patescibacteria group bacterium]|nr:DUF2177 family protein [Patescibacteria group bacterium]
MIYIQFLTGLVVTLVLDGLWLGVITTSLYKKMIGHVMADKPNFIAAALFYPLFVTAIMVFVVTPALNGEWSLWRVVALGGFLGLALYGTYDLTSNAIIKQWPASITAIDIIWGVCITAIVSLAMVLVSRLF